MDNEFENLHLKYSEKLDLEKSKQSQISLLDLINTPNLVNEIQNFEFEQHFTDNIRELDTLFSENEFNNIIHSLGLEI